MPKPKKVQTVTADDPADRTGRLKRIGGSASDAFNNEIANGVFNTLWLKNSDQAARDRQYAAAGAALIGIAPQDELEGMLAGQLVAANAAAMECYRRAMIGEQTFESRKENLYQANRLSKTYVTLLEALNRHRGKGGQQRVTVEHVHVAPGGQAIVGAVQSGTAPGHRDGGGNQRQPHAKALAHAPVTSLRGADPHREPGPLPIAGDAERPMPDARRRLSRRS